MPPRLRPRPISRALAIGFAAAWLLGESAHAADSKSALLAESARAILDRSCVKCHGADRPKARLRLDTTAGALAGGDSGAAVLPGRGADSPLIAHVSRAPGFVPMPPKGNPLSEDEVATLRAWIDSLPDAPPPAGPPGADAEGESAPAEAEHWAFRPLVRPPLPTHGDAMAIAPPNPIDRFLRARLETERLSGAVAPLADRRTLIRRATFDLHGLPPAPEEIDAFVADPAPDPAAWLALVDRLLASPRYGERWARHWLDVARFGETHGFDKDKRRDHAWRYRDWVVRAINDDLPWADFVRMQIAGDAIRPGDSEGAVAVGFLAAGPWDFVGHVELREGTVEKERVRSLDRDEFVTAAIGSFMSLTVQCARCHDHKFDPIPQKDHYALQAVFAGIDRGDRSIEPPEAAARRREIEGRVAEAKRALEQFDAARNAAEAAADATPEGADRAAKLAGARAALAKLTGEGAASAEGTDGSAGGEGGGLSSPTNGYHGAIETTRDVEQWVAVDLGAERTIRRVRLHPARPTDFPDTPGFGFPARFAVEVAREPRPGDGENLEWTALADHLANDFPNPGDAPVDFDAPGEGVRARHARVRATRLWERTGDYVFALGEMEVFGDPEAGADPGSAPPLELARGATVTAKTSVEAGRWTTRALVDGFSSRAPIPSGAPSAPSGAMLSAGLAGRIAADLRARIEALEKARENDVAARMPAAPSIAPSPSASSIPSVSSIPSIRASLALSLAAARAELAALPPPDRVYSATPVAPREVRVLLRGDAKSPQEPAPPGALSGIPALARPLSLDGAPLPADAPEADRRRALAEWIADRDNPLTWRSAVNRVWLHHFGRPLVATPEDFGRFGARPDHPELLDWLAAQFRDGGGSLKALHRLILTSEAYRRASVSNPEGEARDPENRLLWRGTRRRLDAESVRDAMLAVAGDLDPAIGGPSFDAFAFTDDHSPRYDYEAFRESGPQRRSLYRFAVRSVPDPFFEALDCADANRPVAMRSETYGPGQSLALANDRFTLERAASLARKLEAEAADAEDVALVEGRVTAAFERALGRPPLPGEVAPLAEHARRYGLAASIRAIFNLAEFLFVD